MRIIKRLLSLILAAALVLSLAACGETQTHGGEAALPEGIGFQRAPFYQAEEILLPESAGYVAGSCGDGEKLYYLLEDEDRAMTLYRADLAADTVEELPDFASAPADSEPRPFPRGLTPDGAGGLWLLETQTVFTYDLPADFDEEKDSKYQYRSDREDRAFLRRLDGGSGREIESRELTGLTPDFWEQWQGDWTVDSGGIFSGELTVDRDGGCFVVRPGSLTALDQSGNPLLTLEDPALTAEQPPVRLADGGVAALCRVSREDPRGMVDVYTARAVDLEKGCWGPAYELPSESPAGQYVALFGGSGDYLFYATIDQYLYGWNGETGRAERLLSWTRSNINPSGVSFCGMLPDSRPVAMAQTWTDWGVTDGLAVLTESDSLPERTVLTFAGMKISSDQWERIFRFNSLQTEYFIEARDYGDYSTASDLFGGITLLLTEIGAGKVPDILDTSNLPMRQLAAKGMLEDLWPYIDADPDLGRDRLMTHVLETDQVNGGLYEVFGQFTIDTVAGSRDAVGDRTAWTLEDLQAALDTMPAGCGIFSPYDTQEGTLLALLNYMEAQYVDWPAGTCLLYTSPSPRD